MLNQTKLSESKSVRGKVKPTQIQDPKISIDKQQAARIMARINQLRAQSVAHKTLTILTLNHRMTSSNNNDSNQ